MTDDATAITKALANALLLALVETGYTLTHAHPWTEGGIWDVAPAILAAEPRLTLRDPEQERLAAAIVTAQAFQLDSKCPELA